MDRPSKICYPTYIKEDLLYRSEMDMKISRNINVEVFLSNVRKCEGNVYFKTIEGDQLNLKSLLSQYILVSVIDNKELMENGVVECSRESDVALLEPFLE